MDVAHILGSFAFKSVAVFIRMVVFLCQGVTLTYLGSRVSYDSIPAGPHLDRHEYVVLKPHEPNPATLHPCRAFGLVGCVVLDFGNSLDSGVPTNY